jgi:hypothetical protein
LYWHGEYTTGYDLQLTRKHLVTSSASDWQEFPLIFCPMLNIAAVSANRMENHLANPA